jgi:hypothetical protein
MLLCWNLPAHIFHEQVLVGESEQTRFLNVTQFYYLYCCIMDLDDYAAVVTAVKQQVKAPVEPVDSLEDAENECGVCMDRLVEIVFPCLHGFCTECINDWYPPLSSNTVTLCCYTMLCPYHHPKVADTQHTL